MHLVCFAEKDVFEAQADTRELPIPADPYAVNTVKKPLKRIRGVCKLERKLKFCAMPIEHAPVTNGMFMQSAFVQNPTMQMVGNAMTQMAGNATMQMAEDAAHVNNTMSVEDTAHVINIVPVEAALHVNNTMPVEDASPEAEERKGKNVPPMTTLPSANSV